LDATDDAVDGGSTNGSGRTDGGVGGAAHDARRFLNYVHLDLLRKNKRCLRATGDYPFVQGPTCEYAVKIGRRRACRAKSSAGK
jgi:hypothetical protein